jgi:hypothetical protein
VGAFFGKSSHLLQTIALAKKSSLGIGLYPVGLWQTLGISLKLRGAR